MDITDTTIRDLIGFTDPQGVLSLYVEHTSPWGADPQPTAPLEIRERISTLRDDLAARDPDLERAVTDRLKQSEDDIEELLDPKASGRGRALFIGVQHGDTATIALALPFRHRVVHHDSPYVRPLVAAYDEGRDAGILVVSRAGSRLLRWSVGAAEELDSQRFEVPEEQLGREMTGPSPATPSDRRQGNVHREQFEHRIDANHQRFLRDVTEQAVQQAKERGWDRLVIAGSPKTRSAAQDQIGATDGLRLIVADQSWEETQPHDIAQQVWPILRSVHTEREQTLAAAAKDRALAGGPGALGLRDVCDALNEGRVDHLIYDDRLQPTGFRSDAGTLHPDEQDVMSQADVPMYPEPLLIERMIEKAIATDAGVTPLGPEAAADLEEQGGVAAVLRW
jgi:hypothetical protein